MDNKYYNIYYIVTLNESKVTNPFWFKTTCAYTFCGKLINWKDGAFWFELNDSGALIAIPYKWVESMAPSKTLWKKTKEIKEKDNG